MVTEPYFFGLIKNITEIPTNFRNTTDFFQRLENISPIFHIVFIEAIGVKSYDAGTPVGGFDGSKGFARYA